MVTISSNTVVKHGMPFIGVALRRALPYVDQMIITISKKADSRTIEEIKEIAKYNKVEVYWEDIKVIGELTNVENEQIKKSKGDWIWTVEDDDIWLEKDLKECLACLDEDLDGLGISPYLLLDPEHYDATWGKRYITKFFKREGTIMYKPFPINRLKRNGIRLNWKFNPKVKIFPLHYLHLPLLKEYSFRKQPPWNTKYQYTKHKKRELPDKYIKEFKTILDEL